IQGSAGPRAQRHRAARLYGYDAPAQRSRARAAQDRQVERVLAEANRGQQRPRPEEPLRGPYPGLPAHAPNRWQLAEPSAGPLVRTEEYLVARMQSNLQGASGAALELHGDCRTTEIRLTVT